MFFLELLNLSRTPETEDRRTHLWKAKWCKIQEAKLSSHSTNFLSRSREISIKLTKIKSRSTDFSVGCLWHSHGKNPVRLYPKLQSQRIWLRKIFIDYFFFQVEQWDCTKPLSIFDRLASSEERFRTFHCTNALMRSGIPAFQRSIL